MKTIKQYLSLGWIWIRDYYRVYRSRRNWKYFFKYIDKPNIHTKKIHEAIFSNNSNN